MLQYSLGAHTFFLYAFVILLNCQLIKVKFKLLKSEFRHFWVIETAPTCQP